MPREKNGDKSRAETTGVQAVSILHSYLLFDVMKARSGMLLKWDIHTNTCACVLWEEARRGDEGSGGRAGVCMFVSLSISTSWHSGQIYHRSGITQPPGEFQSHSDSLSPPVFLSTMSKIMNHQPTARFSSKSQYKAFTPPQ